MQFKTTSYRSGLIGLAVAGALLAGAIGLGIALVSVVKASPEQPFVPLSLGLIVALLADLLALALLLYWSISALRLRYHLNRNGLVICWGASRLVVPMRRIQAIASGDQMDEKYRAFRGVSWVGLRVGQTLLAGERPARVYTTAPLAESILVSTSDGAYVISPSDSDAFVEAWRARAAMGPTQHWQEEQKWAWPLDLPLWRDHLAWTLVVPGLIVNLALHAYLALIFDRLPAALPFHFDVLGRADRIAGRSEIFRLPQVALLMLVANLVIGFLIYRRVRVASYLIWGGGILLQLLVAAAMLTIIG